MGFLSGLIDALRGREPDNPYSPLTPKDNPPSPSSHDAKFGAKAVHEQYDAAVAGFTSVGSSNVAGVRWFPGTGVLSPIDPDRVLEEGPMGGAPIEGDIRKAPGMGTGLIAAAYAHAGKVTDDTVGTLEVAFRAKKGGKQRTYQYLGCARKMYREMLGAASKGMFVHQRLKGKFPYRRLS